VIRKSDDFKGLKPVSLDPNWKDASNSKDVFMVQLKCFYNGDNRVVDVPSKIELSDLQLRVTLKYGKDVILQYQDTEGDIITIDTDTVLAKAMAQFHRTGLYKLLLIDTPVSAMTVTKTTSATDFGSSFMSSPSFSSPSSSTPKTLEFKDSLFSAFAPSPPKSSVIDSLSQTTHFSREDLEKLEIQFQKTAKMGKLGKAQFTEGMRLIGQTDQVMIDQFFNAFDYDKDGSIDFREFAIGMSIMHAGTLDERLRLAFKAYDLDGNGAIDRRELTQILRSSFLAKGFDQSDEFIQDLVDKCFSQADLDKNNLLDFDEFKSAVLKHQIVVQSFWRNAF